MGFYDEIDNFSMRTFLGSEGVSVPYNSKQDYMVAIRSERTPSCHIDDKRHFFKDFGSGEGGGVIDFVMYFYKERHNRTLTHREANDIIARLAGLNLQSNNNTQGRHTQPSAARKGTDGASVSSPRRRQVAESQVRVQKAWPDVTLSFLLDYAVNTRRIPQNLVNQYLYQVKAKFKKTGREYYYLAFPTSNNSWQLRNSMQGAGKCSVSSFPTIYTSEGDLRASSRLIDPSILEPTSDQIVIFEGFMNFLSALADEHALFFNTDVIVLNSVNNTDLAYNFIAKHDTVYAYYDNDKTGEKYNQMLCERLRQDKPDINYYDMRYLYQEFNDYNDMWKDKCKNEPLINFSHQKETNAPEQVNSESKGITLG